MEKTCRTIVLSLVILALPVLSLAAPVVANSSFEADTFGSATLGFGCENTLTGWDAQCSPDDTYPWGTNNSAYGPTPYGNQFVILGDYGEDGSWIEQAVSGFNVGDMYTLSFAIASELAGGGGSTICVSLTAGDCSTGTNFSAPLRVATYWDTWGTRSLDFIATASTMTIHFEGVPNEIAYDVGLDNVQISGAQGVPEPGTVVLLGAGLLALAGIRGRKLFS